jgi:hypothetical protein
MDEPTFYIADWSCGAAFCPRADGRFDETCELAVGFRRYEDCGDVWVTKEANLIELELLPGVFGPQKQPQVEPGLVLFREDGAYLRHGPSGA